jgi:hypothetical protein
VIHFTTGVHALAALFGNWQSYYFYKGLIKIHLTFVFADFQLDHEEHCFTAYGLYHHLLHIQVCDNAQLHFRYFKPFQ